MQIEWIHPYHLCCEIINHLNGDMKKILLSLIATVSITSCAFGPYLTYNVGLSNVEAPADAKTQYGDTKIIKLDVEEKNNYKYKDAYIDIMWIVT